MYFIKQVGFFPIIIYIRAWKKYLFTLKAMKNEKIPTLLCKQDLTWSLLLVIVSLQLKTFYAPNLLLQLLGR